MTDKMHVLLTKIYLLYRTSPSISVTFRFWSPFDRPAGQNLEQAPTRPVPFMLYISIIQFKSNMLALRGLRTLRVRTRALFAKVIRISCLFLKKPKYNFSKCFNISLRTFGSSGRTICRRTFFQVFRQFNHLAEHKSRYIININH